MRITVTSKDMTDYETFARLEKLLYDTVRGFSNKNSIVFIFESEAARKDVIGSK